jgi:hypothetical protein
MTNNQQIHIVGNSVHKICILITSILSKLFLIVVLLNLQNHLLAQSIPTRQDYIGGVHLQVFGPAALGIAWDWHLSNKFDLDLALGILGQQLGL